MSHAVDGLISIVVPLHNEAGALPSFHAQLIEVLNTITNPYEILYVDDGSSDTSNMLIKDWTEHNRHIRLIGLSRNFGKESALAAGISQSNGDVIIMIDADGQHPVRIIPQFIDLWRNGAQVVVGLSNDKQWQGAFKRIGSNIFHKLFNRFSDQPLIPGSTDFRLIDKEVKNAFLTLKESNRITRGLIDWLGFKREFVTYKTNARTHGTASYNNRKLISLAANSFVSLTTTPMYLFGYLGICITTISFLLGTAIIIEQLILEDPMSWNFTGTAMLGVLIIFLVGLVLMSQGILSLYVSHMQIQSKQRPLFIINKSISIGLTKHDS